MSTTTPAKLDWHTVRPGLHEGVGIAGIVYSAERQDDGSWDLYSTWPEARSFRNNYRYLSDVKDTAARYAADDLRKLRATPTPEPTPEPTRRLVLVGKVGPRYGGIHALIRIGKHTVQVQGQQDALPIAFRSAFQHHVTVVAS